MAIMIPDIPFETFSLGERELFETFKKLSDDYYIFHSVRWTNKYKIEREADFLLFSINYGILVIEVKSGLIRFENRTWYQKNRKTKEEKIIDPEYQASQTKFYLIDRINAILPNNNFCLIGTAIAFPDQELKGNFPPNIIKERIFDKTFFSNPENFINQAFNSWKINNRQTKLSVSSIKKIINLIAPTFSAVPSIRFEFERRERLFLKLTEEQTRIIDFLEQQKTAVLSGKAGTGKTLIGLEKARRIAYKGEKVLFLTLSDDLKSYLKGSNNIENIVFHTFDSLAKEIVSQYYPKINLKNNDLRNIFLEHLVNNKPFNYNHIIIDEGQDFKEEWIEFLSDRTKGIFYVLYDSNQLIFQSSLPDWIKNAECKLTLTKNCRNTFEIARTSNRSVRLIGKITAEVKGNKTFLYECKNYQKTLDKIEKITSQYLIEGKPSDIAILSLKSESSILSNNNKILNYSLSTFPQKNKICFSSVENFKGLEAKIVILIDVNIKEYENKEWRKLMYVGCSRAMHELHILLDNPDMDSYSIAISHLTGNKGKIRKSKNTFANLIEATFKS